MLVKIRLGLTFVFQNHPGFGSGVRGVIVFAVGAKASVRAKVKSYGTGSAFSFVSKN